jgi:hypothetical protein
MPEMGLSGSEGGAGFNPRLLPLSIRDTAQWSVSVTI